MANPKSQSGTPKQPKSEDTRAQDELRESVEREIPGADPDQDTKEENKKAPETPQRPDRRGLRPNEELC